MRLILVRHGQSLGNVEARIQGSEDPLTDFGRSQAATVASAIAARGDVTHLYASPLSRAFETATIIGNAIAVAPTPLAGLAEIDAGTAAGMLWQEWAEANVERAAQISEANRSLSVAWDGGESGHDFSRRVFAAYDEIVTRHQRTGDVVVAVSHGGPLAWISARLHNDPIDVWPSTRGIFANCSLTELEVDPHGNGTIVSLNVITHLDTLSAS